MTSTCATDTTEKYYVIPKNCAPRKIKKTPKNTTTSILSPTPGIVCSSAVSPPAQIVQPAVDNFPRVPIRFLDGSHILCTERQCSRAILASFTLALMLLRET